LAASLSTGYNINDPSTKASPIKAKSVWGYSPVFLEYQKTKKKGKKDWFLCELVVGPFYPLKRSNKFVPL
jgi:hypothetical protein